MILHKVQNSQMMMLMVYTPTTLSKQTLKVLRIILPLIIGVLTIRGNSHEALAQYPITLESKKQQILPSSLTIRSKIQTADTISGVMAADGNVEFFYPSRKIMGTAANAQYYSKERRLVLTGNVVVLQDGGNSIRAETLTYLVDEGKFIATVRETNKQVKSVHILTDE